MRLLLGAAIACAALFFAVPIIAGGNTDICQDVTLQDVQHSAPPQRMASSETMYNVMNSAASVGSSGHEARDEAARLHPHIPPAISCAAGFWSSL